MFLRPCNDAKIWHGTNLVEEEVVDVVGEEGSELALLGLAGAHVHLDLLNESAVKRDGRAVEDNSWDLAALSHDLMNGRRLRAAA